MLGIIMSGESVRAILAGRKTQTMRLILPQPTLVAGRTWEWPCVSRHDGPGPCNPVSKASWGAEVPPGDCLRRFSRYRVGQTYYVQEAWGIHRDWEPYYPKTGAGYVGYRAEPPDELDNAGCGGCPATLIDHWRSAVSMPARFARLFLRVTAVDAMRIQDMTNDDFTGEGCVEICHTLQATYAETWDDLNAKRGYPWSDNPWAWRIRFERVERP